MPFLSLLEKKTNSLFFPSTSLGFRFLMFGILIGFLVRFLMVWLIDYDISKGDASLYIVWANNILNYGIFGENLDPTYYRPPLYSFFLATISWAIEFKEIIIQVFQFLINILAGLMITRISAIYLKNCSHWIFLLMMISPFEAVYAGALISEVITSFLLLSSFFSLIVLKGKSKWILSGIFIGLCCLTRDSYLLLSLFISFFVLIFSVSSFKERIKNCFILILCSFLVVAPWTIRNFYLSDELIPVSQGRLGLGLWLGTWAEDGEWSKLHLGKNYLIFPEEAFRTEEERLLVEGEIAKGKNHVHMEDLYLSLAIERIKEEPFEVLKTYILRSPNLWVGTRFDLFPLNKEWFERGSAQWFLVKSSLWGLNFILLSFCLLGLALTLKRKDRLMFFSIPILYTLIFNFPLNSYEMRYSYPVLPYMLLFACVGWAFVREEIINSRIRKQ